MNFFNDIIYFSYINGRARDLLMQIYKADPVHFYMHLDQIFDLEFRNKILDAVDSDMPRYKIEDQAIANSVFQKFALYLHEHRSDEGNSFWAKRGISYEQIHRYKLGDTGNLTPQDIAKLFGRFSKGESEQFRGYALSAMKCVAEQLLTAKNLYGNSLSVSCPSFDAQGNLTGIVFRTVYYTDKYKTSKNVFKFFNPYSYSFLFDSSIIDKFDELFVVEGIFDALALYRAGVENVISPSMIRMSPWHVEKLKDKKLHVIFDRDLGGMTGLREIKNSFKEENLLTLGLLPSERDFDELPLCEIELVINNVKSLDVRRYLNKSAPVPA